MQKISLIIALFILAITIQPLSAQRKGLSVGVEGGVGMRSLLGRGFYAEGEDPIGAIRLGLGYSAGLSIQYNFSKIVSLRTGLSYDLKGAIKRDMAIYNDYGYSIDAGDIKNNLYYLKLPLMIRASFGGSKVRFMANAGFFGARLVDFEAVAEKKELQNYVSNGSDYYDDYDFGSALGIGGNIKLSEMFNFSFEIRNYMGFLNINGAKYNNSGSTRTMSTLLLIGFSHNLGKTEE